MCHEQLDKIPQLDLTNTDERALAEAWEVPLIWNYYVVGVKKAGVSKDDVGRQFEAEYGMRWTHMFTALPELTGEKGREAQSGFQGEQLEDEETVTEVA